MPDIIHLLPDSVANQIAAGEVIQRPASVLKELVENAIDAEADSIQIILKDAGRTLIRVIDDGKGMSETDARMAFERHATSKIMQASDLFSLHTMGFRGEALPSIASVAQVELRTRRREDELGTLIKLAGSDVELQEPVSCAFGSAFDVKNLFFNVPARRRFLKSDATEMKNLLTEFYRIALVNPKVAFSLVSDEEELYELSQGSTKVRIDELFGRSKKNFVQQLLPINTDTQLVRIRGYVGKPESAHRSASQYFFVNGRYMRHPYFHKAVMNAYGNMLAPDVNPHYFIYLEVDPQNIDVNIHPTKTEIKFADEQAIWPILCATVKESLGKFNVGPAIDFDQENVIDIPVLNTNEYEKVKAPSTSFNPHYNPFPASDYQRKSFDWERLYAGLEKKSDASFSDSTHDVLPLEDNETKQDTPLFDEDLMGSGTLMQLHGKYILTSVKSGLMMIDQQRAHARILYERFLQQMKDSRGLSQKLLFPEILELTPDDLRLFEEMMDDLRLVGFDIDRFDRCAYSINGVPADMDGGDPIMVLNDILGLVRDGHSDIQQTRLERIAFALSKTAMLRSAKELSEMEMRDLLDKLFACKNHAYSPEGKPVIALLTMEELEKYF